MKRSAPVVLHERDCEIEGWDDETRGRVRWRTLLSADRTPTNSLTMGVAELAPGGRTPIRTHRHEQVEAYYVLSGEGIVSIEGVEHPVREGSAVAADSFAHVEYRFDAARSDG